MCLTSRTLRQLSAAFLLLSSLPACSSSKKKENWVHGFEPKTTALLQDGVAHPPKAVPLPVKQALWAGNRIVGKPYRRGGGHKHFEDSGYDCSGCVSYVLHKAGLLAKPDTSGGFRNFGVPGKGKHITVYAKSGHVFIDIAGLRLDTGYNARRGQGPRWSSKPRPLAGFVARHPPGL
jgi:hypothetical protein